MNDDNLDIPEFCKISQADRAAAWRDNPPRPMPTFDKPARQEEPATRALRLELERTETDKRAAKRIELDKLAARKKAEAAELKATRELAAMVNGAATVSAKAATAKEGGRKPTGTSARRPAKPRR